jgi:hypothetical protein
VVNDTQGAAGALDTSTKSLDSGETDFFKLLNKDTAVAKKDAHTEANVVYSFNSHRSAIVLWLRWTSIEEHTQGLKKDKMYTSFAVPKTTKSKPKLFLILEVMGKILTEAHS